MKKNSKNWMKSLALLVLSLSSLGLSSCISLGKPPNEEGCVRKIIGAKCTYMINGPTTELSEAEWLEIRLGRISFSAEGYAKIRAFIERSCTVTKKCKATEILQNLDELSDELL